jgi:FdhE protein
MGELHALVSSVAADVAAPMTVMPDWESYAGEFRDGVPLLDSQRVAIDFAQTEEALRTLLRRLLSEALPGGLQSRCRAVERTLEAMTESDDLELGTRDPLSSGDVGLLRYLTWALLARQLGPLIDAFARWHDDERWLRNYCPMCGEPPAMAQLVSKESSRLRLLSCGCCRTRWRYRRTGCPFCEPRDDHRLAVVAIEGEQGLRIDFCDTCTGYLKTYDGEGHESVMLADWTSLHLDVLARDRGLKRMAASLFEI